MAADTHPYDQVVYLLQGGGALGTYQVGVCEVLMEHGYDPDWVIGTSIGAINAALIAGNKAPDRIARLKSFWNKISFPLPTLEDGEHEHWLRKWQKYLSAAVTLSWGQDNFFYPRVMNPWLYQSTTPDKLSFYDTTILQKTLEEHIDFDYLNSGQVHLTLGATSLKDGEEVEFDNLREIIGPEHIMASGALPPGFPAVEIKGEYYWDGGVISNTPLSMILREKAPQKLLCFMVNLFSHIGKLPENMLEVFERRKDLSLASHHHQVLHYLCQLHQYQHLIYQLEQKMKNSPSPHDEICETIRKIADMGHPKSCNIVRFHYQNNRSDSWCKDFEFSEQTQKEHLKVGRQDALCAMRKKECLAPIPDDSGVVMHNYMNGESQCEHPT